MKHIIILALLLPLGACDPGEPYVPVCPTMHPYLELCAHPDDPVLVGRSWDCPPFISTVQLDTNAIIPCDVLEVIGVHGSEIHDTGPYTSGDVIGSWLARVHTVICVDFGVAIPANMTQCSAPCLGHRW